LVKENAKKKWLVRAGETCTFFDIDDEVSNPFLVYCFDLIL
jgi:hypothetical protein